MDHPNLPLEKQRYEWELLKQAEILAMSGDDGIEAVLGALRHRDFYVRVIAALALDRLLSVEYAKNIYAIGDKSELWLPPQEDNALVRRYIERSRQCFPVHFKKAQQPGADQPATKPADNVPVKDHPPSPASKDGPR